MSTLASNVVTLADWVKTQDPNGTAAAVVELLSQSNELLTDMLWKEGNLPTGHRITMRSGLPTVAFRLLNKGVAKSKSNTAQIDEACAILEGRSEIDVDLANLNGATPQFRMSQATAFGEAMNQQMATSLFYGNSSTSPEQFTGLSARYSSLSAENARCIVSGAGAGADNSSIWLIVWGEGCHGIFPKGSQAGLIHEDLGVQDAFDASNNRFRAYCDRWQWKCGMALPDWRQAVRMPNIDISDLVGVSAAADIIEMMIKATHRVQNLRGGKPVFYMNRTVMQMLDILRRNDVISGGGLTYDNVDGIPQYSFRGIPVRLVDALTQSESVVS